MRGWAIQVPSWPLVTSLSLSARTLFIATSFAFSSFLMGIWADIPPIAATLRLKLVRNFAVSLGFKLTCDKFELVGGHRQT